MFNSTIVRADGSILLSHQREVSERIDNLLQSVPPEGETEWRLIRIKHVVKFFCMRIRAGFGTLSELKMMMTQKPPERVGPSILAVDPWPSSNHLKGRMHQLLNDEERAQLATIASVVRFKKGSEIYRSGEQATAMFNIISGVVKAYSGEDAGHITAFLFPGDLFGLSQEGAYTNSVKAVTPVTAYQLPLSALRSRLTKDAILEYHLICKLCQDLRYSQRHAFLVAQRHANSKIATFLQMLEQLQVARIQARSIFRWSGRISVSMSGCRSRL
jgi:CRP/FNR family transcriptional regulator